MPTCRVTVSPSVEAGMRNMVAPPAPPGSPLVRAMVMKKPAPSAPVMKRLSPLTTHPPSTLVARVASIEGSAPAPGAGSVIAKAERTSPRASGSRYFSRWAVEAMWSSMWMLPSSGALMLRATGPKRE